MRRFELDRFDGAHPFFHFGEDACKTEAMMRLEARFHMPIGTLLSFLYYDQQLNQKEVGEYLGISETTIYTWFKLFPITARNRSEARELVDTTRVREVTIQKANDRRKQAFGSDIRLTLIRMHYENNMTLEEIAEETGYDYTTLTRYMKRHTMTAATMRPGWVEAHTRLGAVLGNVWADPSLMSHLSQREADVLVKRHLIHTATVEEIGYELGISKSAVSQLEHAAINKLTAAAKAATITE